MWRDFLRGFGIVFGCAAVTLGVDCGGCAIFVAQIEKNSSLDFVQLRGGMVIGYVRAY
jgi:hypothetical protein